MSEGFNGGFDAPDIISLGQSQKDGNLFFLAFHKQTVIAGASLYVADKIARLGGMVTLKEHRLQGAQTALIAFRMAVAQKMGCTLLTTETEPGNKSQQNLEKAGFKLVYVRNVFRKNS